MGKFFYLSKVTELTILAVPSTPVEQNEVKKFEIFIHGEAAIIMVAALRNLRGQ
jgi:hypothetical protein